MVKELLKRTVACCGFGQTDTWDAAAKHWERYSSPFRPSPMDTVHYRDLCPGVTRSSRVLLLGATPEIRQWLSTIGCAITVMDYSRNMFTGMRRFLTDANRCREEFICADWLSMERRLRGRTFDFIFGDLVLRNIAANAQAGFLRKVGTLLATEGRFVSRIHHVDETLAHRSADEVLHAVLRITEKLSLAEREDAVMGRLFDRFIDEKRVVTHKAAIVAAVKSYMIRRSCSESETALLRSVLDKWPASGRNWTQRSEPAIRRLLEEQYHIIDRKKAADYIDAEHYPIYALKKRHA